MTVQDDKEGFLQRWSRLKRDVEQAQPALPETAPAGESEAPLPGLDDVQKLDFSSDFTPFLRAKVEESVKRAALNRLFQSPHFNQMDGLDVYIDDYGDFEPIDDEMLRQLAHARDLLFRYETADRQAEGGESTRAEPVSASISEPGAPASGSDIGQSSLPAESVGKGESIQERKRGSANQ